MLKIGLIDFYIDEWHANHYPKWIRETAQGNMAVAYAYAMCDSICGGRTTEKWCRDMGIERVFSIEELVEKSDALIILSPDHCQMHEALCQIPLRSGKRTYVDKAFAPDYDTAVRIFAVANSYKTQCYSASALRFAPEYKNVHEVQAISSWGTGDFETHAIHQIEPAMMLMKSKALRVMALQTYGYAELVIEFEDRRTATISCFKDGSPFMMNLCLTGGSKLVKIESDFFHEFTLALVDFLETGLVPVRQNETLEIIAVLGAGFEAFKKTGQWVGVRTIV